MNASEIKKCVKRFRKEYNINIVTFTSLRDVFKMQGFTIIKALDLLNVDYNKVSAYGHFGKSDMPWEQ